MRLTLTNRTGLSLIELMVALAITSIVMAAIYGVFSSRQKSHVTQKLLVEMQQNARAAMSLMKREIRLAGYDPASSDGIDNDGDGGAEDVDSDERDNAGIVAAGPDAIQFTMDLHLEDHPTWGTDGLDNDVGGYDGLIDNWKEIYDMKTTEINEDITYRLAGGDLIREDPNAPVNPSTLAYDIDEIRFAYAFDTIDDGQMELEISPNEHIIWAVDMDDDGFLDTVLDTNDDGVIDSNDAPGGVDMDPAFWPVEVEIDRIRAVRIWLLASTSAPIQGFSDNSSYVVGDQHLVADDGFKRCLLTGTVFCKNMGY